MLIGKSPKIPTSEIISETTYLNRRKFMGQSAALIAGSSLLGSAQAGLQEDDEITPEADGSYLVRGNAYLRDINRQLQWELPTDNAKTVNGLIIDHLEDIPEAATCFRLGDYTVEIVQSRDTSVYVARLMNLNQA